MKFSSAIDVVQKENRFLRSLVQFLMLLLGGLALVDVLLFDRTPIVVERSNRGLEIVRATELVRAPADVETAVGLMMKARFDSSAKSPELFMNAKELLLRDTEQKEMKSRSMTQSIVVRGVKIEKDDATAEIDRVISIGDLRSALRAKVRVTFEEVPPNEVNPYGLLLSTAEPVQAPSPKKDERSK